MLIVRVGYCTAHPPSKQVDKIDPGKYAELEQEVERLRAENQQMKISRSIEQAFYRVGGKRSEDDDADYTYFDMVHDHAVRFIKVDEQGRILIIDPKDGTRLKTSSGEILSLKDLMIKFRKSPALADCFDLKSNPLNSLGATRESLREIKDPAARLARARELGLK